MDLTAPATFAASGPLRQALQQRLDALATGRVVPRIWAHDHTVWKPDPDEITDRLDWLTVARDMLGHIAELEAFRRDVLADSITSIVLLGMGGSILAAEVISATLGEAAGLPVTMLNSTHPAQVRSVAEACDLQRTLFLVASKSGGTIETRSHFDYFWDLAPDGRNFAVITDAGSALDRLGQERAVRHIFRNPEGIGGRFSALSLFGLVPAALAGADLRRFLAGALEMMQACGPDVTPAENPGAWLGAVLGEAALSGRGKLTLLLPPELATFGAWVEQLVAESTGKEGRGILPVEGEALASPEVYGHDRLFVVMADACDTGALEAAGHPIVRIPWGDRYQLGADFFRWELATAVAGHILGINPFDQPNVQEAKAATARILDHKGDGDAGGDASSMGLADLLASVRPGDYVAILAYLPLNAETAALLAQVRGSLQARLRVATTVGFGPRYLHSTGQLHKGGPANSAFVVVLPETDSDVPIPGRPYSFGTLVAAQARGDVASLQAHGRRVAAVSLAELLAEV